MTRGSRSSATAGVVMFAIAAFPFPAGAEEPQGASTQDGLHLRAAAEAAFAEARALVKQGRWTEACPKLEASFSLDAALGTSMNLADCHARIGKTASAWVRYREAASLARVRGELERERIARERANALEPLLCRMKIVTHGAAGSLVVRRNGEVVPPSAYGIAVPVDGGTHVVTAERSGQPKFAESVEIAPSSSVCAETVIVIPSQAEAATDRPAPRRDEELPTVPPNAGSWNGIHTLSVVLAGASLVALGVGAAYGIDATSTKAEADDACAGGCTDRGRELRAEAGRSADVATAGFATSGILFAGAALAWLLSPPLRARRATGAARVRALAGPVTLLRF